MLRGSRINNIPIERKTQNIQSVGFRYSFLREVIDSRTEIENLHNEPVKSD